MTKAASLVVSLRAAGISIKNVGGRLLVEAPDGTITPEIRVQLVNHKAELVATLEFEERQKAKDPITLAAFREVTELLVTACRRWHKIRRIPPVVGSDPSDAALALSDGESAHVGDRTL